MTLKRFERESRPNSRAAELPPSYFFFFFTIPRTLNILSYVNERYIAFSTAVGLNPTQDKLMILEILIGRF